jgi:hypothetical protein
MRGLTAAVLLAAGAATGVAAVAVHGRWWGVVLATAAVVAALGALRPGWSTRLPFGIGFGAVVLRLAVARPEGDVVVAGDPRGYVVLALAFVVVVAAVATLPRPGVGRHGDVPAEP